MGVVLLGERLRPLQWVAVGIGAAAVVVLTVDYGRLPYVALVLAFSFGSYGLCKKTADVGADREPGLRDGRDRAARRWLPRLARPLVGSSAFAHSGAGQAALFMAAGVVTAVPLLCFGAAATRVSMITLGLLQYLTPTLQFAPRRPVLPRGHAARPLDRLRAGLGRAGDLHRRGAIRPAGAGLRGSASRPAPPPDRDQVERTADDVGEGLEGLADRAGG